MRTLKLLRASAGSGKTFALAATYLELLFQPNVPFNKFTQILAVTFTNKATEEMKTRIIENLVFLANGRFDDDNPIALPILKLNDNKRASVIKKANIILREILHNYAYFNIKTIDSFSQNILRNFYFELKMHPAYEVELDTSKAQEFLIEKLVNEASQKEDIQQWIFDLIDTNLEDEKSWSFYDALEQLTMTIFTEKFHEIQGEIAELQNSDLQKTIDNIKSTLKKIKSLIQSKTTKILAIVNQYNLEPNYFWQKGKGTINVVSQLHQNILNFDSFKTRTNFNKWIANPEEKFMSNAPEHIDQHQIYNKLHPLLLDLKDTLISQKSSFYTASILKKNIYLFGLFIELADYINDYRSDNNVLFSNDVNKLLHDLIDGNDVSFIYEKAGERYSHFMIDEFQDTSKYQWEIYRPLISNSLANNHQNLIVGDIKQAIYRWREGDFELLLHKVKEDISRDNYPELIEDESLSTNFRSEANVVSFNNYVFGFLPEMLQNIYINELNAIEDSNPYITQAKETILKGNLSHTLTEIYKDVKQLTPEKKQFHPKGSVAIKLIQQQKGLIIKDALLALMNEQLFDLITHQKVSPGEIGILARSKKELQLIVSSILAYWEKQLLPPLNIVTEESLLVKDSPAIKIIQAVFKYMVQADDLYLRELAYNYCIVHQIPYIKSLQKDDFLSMIPPRFNQKLSYWKELSLYESLQYIIDFFELDRIEPYSNFIAAYNEHLYNYTQKHGNLLIEFLEWWEQKMDKLFVALTPSKDSIQAMTIHKSKGLDFEHVFIPFCDMKIEHYIPNNSGNIWVRPVTINAPYPVAYSPHLIESEFAHAYLKEKMYKIVDTVNGFYVACTRARQGLYLYGSLPKSNNNKTISQLLYRLFQEKHVISDDEKIYFHSEFIPNQKVIHQDIQSIACEIYYTEFGHDVIQKDAPQKEDNLIHPSIKLSTNWNKLITIRKNSSRLFDEDTMDEKRVDGIILHKILSYINSIEDLDDAINKVIKEGWIKEDHKNQYRTIIFSIIDDVNIRPFFKAEKVINERAILSRDQGIKIPDRVVKLHDGSYWVLDYKFSTQLAIKKHIQQINSYKYLLEEITNQKVQAGLVYYDFNTVKFVVVK